MTYSWETSKLTGIDWLFLWEMYRSNALTFFKTNDCVDGLYISIFNL